MNGNFEYRFGPGSEWRILVANNRDLREKAFRLVYDVYIREGYDLRFGRDSGLWCTIHHLHPSTVILLAEKEERIVGSVTVVCDSRLGLPTERIFPEPLAVLRRAGRRLSEISSLVVTEEPSGFPPELAMHLYRLTRLAAVHLHGSTDIVASVMAHHAAFYTRFLLFDDVSPEPRISPKTGQKVSYARLNLVTMRDRYEQRYTKAAGRRNLFRWFFQDDRESATVEWLRRSHHPMSTEDLYHFGAERTHILAKAGADVIAILEEEFRQADTSAG